MDVGIATSNPLIVELFVQLLPDKHVFQSTLPAPSEETIWIVDKGVEPPLKGQFICLGETDHPRASSLQIPFSLAELHRSLDQITASPPPIILGSLMLDSLSRTLSHNDTPHTVTLTEKEAELLCWLHAHPDHIFSREDLLDAVWRYSPALMTHTVETHIYRLRKKLSLFPDGAQILESRDSGYTLHLPSLN